MLDYDPVTDLRHYPLPMGRFGKNPYGENLYRIVYSDSRRNLVGGLWNDGTKGYRWAPTYDQIRGKWVLERWLAADEFAGCSRESWDSTLVDPNSGYLLLGPYPFRGEYQHCHTFETCDPLNANLDKLISWIEEGRRRRFTEHRAACQKSYEDEAKSRRGNMDALIGNALPAYGTRPFISGTGVSRGTKTDYPLRRRAEELGLPVGHNKLTTRGNYGSYAVDGIGG